jgi:hypothetical protein
MYQLEFERGGWVIPFFPPVVNASSADRRLGQERRAQFDHGYLLR